MYSKIYTIFFVVYIGAFFWFYPKKDTVDLKIQWNSQLYNCVVDVSEFNDLLLKDKNSILFFDGEHFFEIPPYNKNHWRCSIVKHFVKNEESHYLGVALSLFFILLFFNPWGDNEPDYEYDM